MTLWWHSLISLISFSVYYFGCGIGEPLVATLHHCAHSPRLPEVTQFDAWKVRAKDQNVVELHVSMANFPKITNCWICIWNCVSITSNACTPVRQQSASPPSSSGARRCHCRTRSKSNRLKERKRFRDFGEKSYNLQLSSPNGAYSCVKT